MAIASMRAPSRPSQRLRPDRVSRCRRSASAWRSSAPRDTGTDDQPTDRCDLMIVKPYELSREGETAWTAEIKHLSVPLSLRSLHLSVSHFTRLGPDQSP